MLIYGLRTLASPEYRYVGLTTKTAQERLRSHVKRVNNRSLKNYPVNDWISKHGCDNIVIDILEDLSGDTLEDLCDAEIFWIFALRYLGHRLLNVSEGGRGPNGHRHTEETKRMLSELHKGNTYNVGRPGNRNLRHSDEQKRKWSEDRKGSITGEKNPNYGKVGQLSHLYGRVVSGSTRSKASEAKVGEKNPNYGKSPSAETRLKQSQATKGIARPSSAKSAHTRHHTNKNVQRPDTCKFCKEKLEQGSN